MININLLADQHKRVVEREKQAGKADKLATWVFGGAVMVFALAALSLLGTSVLLNRAEEQILTTERRLRELGDVEEKLVSIDGRLKEIGKILEGRDKTRSKLDVVFRLFDQGSSLRSLTFGGVSGGDGFEIVGDSDGVFAYLDFDLQIAELAEEQGFVGLSLVSLSRKPTGEYDFNYGVELGDVDTPGGPSGR